MQDSDDSEAESGSEEEDDSEDEGRHGDGEGVIDPRAWGKKKSAYYSTDFIDEDLGSDYGKSDSEAEEEEKEALRLQKEYAEQYDEVCVDGCVGVGGEGACVFAGLGCACVLFVCLGGGGGCAANIARSPPKACCAYEHG